MGGMDLKRSIGGIPVARELLLNAGLIEPTEIEQAKAERASAEYQARAERRAAALAVAREQLAALTDPLARAVLDLHHEDDLHECAGCDYQGWEAEGPDWPCTTVRLVAKQYGITLP
jgi:hypothetical protein